ncbi:MAG: DUF427 domain-containing protein [Pseudomonadota bacterium]
MLTDVIRNPDNPDHFMRIKPVSREVTVTRKGIVLARSDRALRIMEVGKDLYDPVFYLPIDDVRTELTPVPDRSTHCPLKGDASYFAMDAGSIASPIAWTYDRSKSFADALSGHIAFYPDAVSITEAGPET